MRRLWLIFAQAVTVGLAILFVVSTLRPDWLQPGGRQPAAPPAPSSAPQASAEGAGAAVASYADAVARAVPWVVNVYTTKHIDMPLLPVPGGQVPHLYGQMPGLGQRSSFSLGSGVIVSPEGYVLTNYHVVEAADAIELALSDGRRSAAKVVGADPETDLAVLKLEGDLGTLPAALLAEGAPRVGDVVLAIGNPFGVGLTTTQGIVSAVGRTGLGINTYENFIQTDAAINPGNSGGALVDAQGRLVGINTAIYSEGGGSLGIGFAIPIESAHRVMDEIIRTGVVKRGWLGVEPQDVTPDLARAFDLPRDTRGVVIAGVMRNGPAAKAGLRVGDIVRRVNDAEVADTMTMLAMIAALPPGETAMLQVLRGGKNVVLKVEVGTRPARPR